MMKSIIAAKTSVASSSVPCLKKNATIAMLRMATHIPRPIIRIPANIGFQNLLRAKIPDRSFPMTGNLFAEICR